MYRRPLNGVMHREKPGVLEVEDIPDLGLYDACDCPLPFLERKHNPYLGRQVVIRTCCVARVLSSMSEIPLYVVQDWEPGTTWSQERFVPAEWNVVKQTFEPQADEVLERSLGRVRVRQDGWAKVRGQMVRARVEKLLRDGEKEEIVRCEQQLGEPPLWLKSRFEEKGISWG